MLSATDIRDALIAMRSLGFVSFEDWEIPSLVSAITLELDDARGTAALRARKTNETKKGRKA